jgi:hypothetical protein
MFLVVVAAYAGGVSALVALWSYSWLVALVAAPFAGSAAAAAVFLLLTCMGKREPAAPRSSTVIRPVSAF